MRAARRLRRVTAVALTILTAAYAAPAAAQGNGVGEAGAAAHALFQAQDWAAAAEAYKSLTADNPGNGGFWYRLGASYHRLEKYREAIDAFGRARDLGTAAVASAYNMACAHALLGENEQAFVLLAESIDAGFNQLGTIRSDTDLDGLRGDPRFDKLVARVEAAAFPCKHNANHKKLDFWIGSWDVYVNGQLAGTNDIESVADGCALTESWTNASGSKGFSLNYFDDVEGKYKQIWVASGKRTVYVEETAADGSLVLVARSNDANGNETLSRLTFTRQGANVRQFFETSTDDGKTWAPGFDGLYVPREAN